MTTQQPEPIHIDHFLGLDLGQSQDYSAACVLERRIFVDDSPLAEEPEYSKIVCRHLTRWKLGTGYVQIVAEVCKLLDSKAIAPAMLIVDQTGVGRGVVDLFRQEVDPELFQPIQITAGSAVTSGDGGTWNVPKKELVSTMQTLLQCRRFSIVPTLPLAKTISDEFQNFRVKITLAGNETFEAWRERDHDDLVLSVALAAYVAERTEWRTSEPMNLGGARQGHRNPQPRGGDGGMNLVMRRLQEVANGR